MAGGAVIGVATILYAFAVDPLARRWSERETRIELQTEQLQRLVALVDEEAALDELLSRLREEQSETRQYFFEGATPAIGASALLVLLNRYANESAVVLERVDVADEAARTEEGLLPIPARLSGMGDVYGLVDFLYRLQHGQKLVVVDEFVLSTGQAFRPGRETGLARWTIDLHGYYAGERAVT